ncbi:perlucin-like [Anopheles cruzii]|uniref:perlucin-like n=1 Tax=Anopheles cruzii TaxID=68878 RepID=UPI0022EC3A60|nr:perlucin-like [Anopheles cruzii]
MRYVVLVFLFVGHCLSSPASRTNPVHERIDVGAPTNAEVSKRYYVFNSRGVTFFEAWRLCQSVGHRLATITNQNDTRSVEEAVQASSNSKGPWWIAGTDLGNEGVFVWISTNQPVGFRTGYSDYAPNQPDNAGGNENCLEIGREGALSWNDAPCDAKHRYICEHGG